MKNKQFLFITVILVFATACTDLDETLFDRVPSSEFGRTPQEIETLVGAAYASLRGFSDDVLAWAPSEFVLFLNLTTSDEATIPTRGSDWYDEGRYQQAQRHTWDANNVLIYSAWRYAFYGINSVNAIIFQVGLSELPEGAKTAIFAELRGLRAYYYFLLLDWFGNVPIVTSFGETVLPTNSSRAEVFQFVENELLDIVEYLPTQIIYGRFTQNVANTLLARLYLNAEVFTGEPRWQECLDVSKKVVGYMLEPNYFANFLTENQHSRENIFVIPYDHRAGTLGNYMNSMSLHYNQRQAYPGPWQWSANGMSAQPGVFSMFDDNDIRKASMQEGPQYVYGTRNIILMGDGRELIYTEEIPNFENAAQNHGVRLYKYEVRADEQWERDHDFVIMRYAEILMMQAECYIRLGLPELARPLVRQIRERAGLDTPDVIDLEFLDEEYLREFIFEGKRRTVNIRFGTFFEPWWEKGSTPAYRGIFPIPQIELDRNENLVQNPGY